MKPGPTGKYPEGRLSEDDEGGLMIAVGSKEGKIVINFGKDISWIALNPEEAMAFADAIKTRAKDLLN
jgi:hypothetical protein